MHQKFNTFFLSLHWYLISCFPLISCTSNLTVLLLVFIVQWHHKRLSAAYNEDGTNTYNTLGPLGAITIVTCEDKSGYNRFEQE